MQRSLAVPAIHKNQAPFTLQGESGKLGAVRHCRCVLPDQLLIDLIADLQLWSRVICFISTSSVFSALIPTPPNARQRRLLVLFGPAPSSRPATYSPCDECGL